MGENNAARQAMAIYAGEVARLAEEPKVKGKKRKAEPGLPGQIQGGELSGQPAPPAPQQIHPSPKSEMMHGLSKILGRTLVKDDMLFSLIQTPLGFQAYIQLPGLPGDWSHQAWAGEVAKTKKDTEMSACVQAWAAVQSNPAFMALLMAKAPKTKSGKQARDDAAFTPMEHTRITPSAVTGAVEIWKGPSATCGWVKLMSPLEHPQASLNSGLVYLHKKDWTGVTPPEVGQAIYMHIYVDGTGMGAEEARALV